MYLVLTLVSCLSGIPDAPVVPFPGPQIPPSRFMG